MEWMLLPYRRYAEFNGRSRRKEFWLFQLFFWGTLLALMIISRSLAIAVLTGVGPSALGAFREIFLMIFLVGSIVPHISVTVRRLHDQDKSGWMYLISFIPYIGGLILLILMCIEGTDGENQYGPDPKNLNLDTSVFS